jgi:hypothetical protein
MLLAACPAKNTPLAPVVATADLKKAQDLFTEASKSVLAVGPEATPSQTVLDQYRGVVKIVEADVLPRVTRDDLMVNALALDAFSNWRIGNFDAAVDRSQQGLDICKRAQLASNRRDCAMLLVTGGLVQHERAFREFKSKGSGLISAADAQAITQSMNDALAKIDRVNDELAKDEDFAIWANEQQLQIIKNALDVWGKVPNVEDRRHPVCTWSQRGDRLVADRFPESFPQKQEVQQLLARIDAARARFEPC